MSNAKWVQHAYPLQQITIRLQGTKHSDQQNILRQLEEITTRIRAGDVVGESSDDDFGYHFEVDSQSNGPSFFGDAPASQK